MARIYLDGPQATVKKRVYLDGPLANSNPVNSPEVKKDLIDKLVGMTPQEMDDRGEFLAGALQRTAKDVLTIPANFANQALLNFPRAITQATGNEYPSESDNKVSQIANKAGGVAGAIAGVVPKMLVSGSVNVLSKFAPKVIRPLSETGAKIGQKVASGIAAGAIGGATTAPENLDYRKLPAQVASGAALGGIGARAGDAISKAFRPVSEKVSKAISRNAKVYAELIRPEKGELKNFLLTGKDVNKYYRLAAEEGIVIKKMPDANKMDTSEAIASLADKRAPLEDQLTSALASNRSKQFNLLKIGEAAKNSLRGRIKNATDLKEALADVDQQIADHINLYGQKVLDRTGEIPTYWISPYVDGSTANLIKQGMWARSYNESKPNTQDVSRQIGNVIKNKIELLYPEKSIREINTKLGDYHTLEGMLAKAHGRVIKDGQLGKQSGAVVGAVTGATAIPVVGPAIGAMGGRKVVEMLNDPERITRGLKLPDASSPDVLGTIGNKVRPVVQDYLRKAGQPGEELANRLQQATRSRVIVPDPANVEVLGLNPPRLPNGYTPPRDVARALPQSAPETIFQTGLQEQLPNRQLALPPTEKVYGDGFQFDPRQSTQVNPQMMAGAEAQAGDPGLPVGTEFMTEAQKRKEAMIQALMKEIQAKILRSSGD